MVTKILQQIKKELTLFLAALCAVISICIIPIDEAYWGYVDLRVLCLLFCFMALVEGLKSCNIFLVLAQKLLEGEHSLRLFVVVLVFLPFFTSMFITNDVSLITFVPFALLTLHIIQQTQLSMLVVVLQTIAANLGSMVTPFGNPQNLYLFSKYEMSMGAFLQLLMPFALVSLLLLLICTAQVKRTKIHVTFPQKEVISHRKDMVLFTVLFLCCILCVLHVIHYGITFVLVLAAMLLRRRELLKHVDYSLLLTFVCFFIFSGNIARIDAVHDLLAFCMEKYALICAILCSQVISNVPASILLSGFTERGDLLVIGTNLGGLGTLVASLASLISFKFYINEYPGTGKKYIALFTAYNVGFLAVLLCVYHFFG